MVRVERFELITKLILSQPPLPIGLHARMPIAECGFQNADSLIPYHTLLRSLVDANPRQSAIRNLKSAIGWCSRRDSNPHCTDFESVVSCQLDYASRYWCCRKDSNLQLHGSQPCASSSCATTALVPAEGFEPTLSSS